MKLARQRFWVSALGKKRPRDPIRAMSTQSENQNIFVSTFKPVPLPKCTLPELMWERLDQWPDQTAVECGVTGRSFTYAQLQKDSRRLAMMLLKFGLRPGSVVTAIMPNIPEYLVTIFGTMEAGLVVTGINPLYSPEEISYQMKDSGSRFAIVHPDLLGNLLVAKKLLGEEVTVLCVHDYDGRTRPLPPGVIGFSDFIGAQRDSVTDGDLNRQRGHVVDLEETTFLPYSSGTTGLPKGVCLTHNNLTANVAQSTSTEINPIDPATKNQQDTVPVILPLYHIYGSVVVMMRALYGGAKLVTLPKFEPKPFLNVLESNENIVLYAVPPIILFLTSHPTVSNIHFDHLKVTMTGGAPCGGDDIARLCSRKKHPIIQGYGMTESSPLLTQSPITSKKFASIGKLVCNTEAKVVDLTTGNAGGTNVTGELCFRGPQVMKCYHNNPKATAETVDSDGWLHTGDVGYVDEDGDYFVVDRIKELIKVKGYQVAPAELESVLRNSPDVLDAAVTAMPCPKSGEAPIAFVIRKPGSTSLSESSLKEFVAEKVASYKKISKIVFVESIPKSPTGKILRKQLKEIAKKDYS